MEMQSRQKTMTPENRSEKSNVALFEKMPVGKAMRKMVFPAVAAQLVILLYNLTDTYFLGKTNNAEMVAAVSLILPLSNISVSLTGLSGAGGSALIAKLLGKQQEKETDTVYRFCICFGIIISILFALFCSIFRNFLLEILGVESTTYDYAASYMRWVIIAGSVPTILSGILAMLLRGGGYSKQAGIGVIIGAAVNFVLDPVFMFCILPPGMEIAGAGVATLISNVASCLYFIVIFRKKRKVSVLRMHFADYIPSKENLKSIFQIGVPYAIATLLYDINYMVLDRLMTEYGSGAVAATGIVLRTERFPLAIGTGICQGMMPLVAYNYAAKNWERMKELKKYAGRMGIIITILCALLFEMFAGNIIQLFMEDAEILEAGEAFLRIRALAMPFMFFCFYTVYLFNGYGKGKQALFLGVIRWMVFNIPLLYLLHRLLGMYGLIWGQLAGDILTVFVSWLFLWKQDRNMKEQEDRKR